MFSSFGKVCMTFINRLSQRVRFPLVLVLVLALPVLLYFVIALFWQSRGLYPITGDEPHYLLITDSLVRDHDLRVDDNYFIDTPVQQAVPLRLSEQIGFVHKHFSVHNIGLPIILTIPYSLGGVVGAKIFLALLAGLWPLLLYKVLVQVTQSPSWSVIIACILSIGLPFSAAANQIYPDLPSGMIILWVTGKIFASLSDKGQRRASLATNLWIVLLIAFLPWLHLRLGAPAIVLLLAHIYGAFTRSRHGPVRSFQYRNLIPVSVFIGSMITLGIYNTIAFSNIFGPYERNSLSFEFEKVSMIFLGLHWDQSQGMFLQQPLLLLGLVGIAPLIKENRLGAALLGVLYVSIILPNSMHTNWYGGFSFVGRFWWAAIAVWIFPLAFAIRFLLVRKRLLLLLFCMGTLGLQAWFAAKWLFVGSFLLNRPGPIWASRSFFDSSAILLLSLPTFKDFNSYARHPANYVFVLLGLLLVITGWLWRGRSNRQLGKILAAFLVVGIGIVMLVPPATGSWTLEAVELPSRLGTVEGTSRVATEKDGAGTLSFGPYTMLLAGRYELKLEYESSGTSDPPGKLDVVYGPEAKVVADVDLPPSDTNNGTFKYEFPVREWQSLSPPFQFRVKYAGHGNLKEKSLTITPISLYHSTALR
jgi:hypothetical protein